MKNNLQVISSLLNLQAHRLSDLQSQELFMESQSRVQTIALVHENIYQSENLSHVHFAEYVAALVDGLLRAHDGVARGIGASLELGDVRLSADAAIPCGLIINELVTNSLKHGFPAGRSGRISVALQRVEPDRVQLWVADDGVGLPRELEPGRAKTLGLELVFTFAEQLGAAVQVEREQGTGFRFVFRAGGV
jgi:two-component sensor histidine kinase